MSNYRSDNYESVKDDHEINETEMDDYAISNNETHFKTQIPCLDEENNKNISKKLAEWCVKYKIRREASDELLKIICITNPNLPTCTNCLFTSLSSNGIMEPDTRKTSCNEENINEQNNSCKNCKILLQKFSKLEKSVARNTVYLEKILKKIHPNTSNIHIFPLKTIEELENVDEALQDDSAEDIINTMKEILGNSKPSACFDYLFSKEVLLATNWDGAKTKIQINKFKTFNTYLFEAAKNINMGYPEYENDMRKGFRLAKSRVYKKNFRSKTTSAKQTSND